MAILIRIVRRAGRPTITPGLTETALATQTDTPSKTEMVPQLLDAMQPHRCKVLTVLQPFNIAVLVLLTEMEPATTAAHRQSIPLTETHRSAPKPRKDKSQQQLKQKTEPISTHWVMDRCREEATLPLTEILNQEQTQTAERHHKQIHNHSRQETSAEMVRDIETEIHQALVVPALRDKGDKVLLRSLAMPIHRMLLLE